MRCHGRGGAAAELLAGLACLPSAAARAYRCRAGARRHGRVLARLGRPGDVGRPLWRSGAALAADAEGAHLRRNGRYRRGRHDLAAGAARWPAQLGLSILLAARRDADAVRADAERALRGSRGLARLAAPVGRGQPGADPDHVRPQRRAAVARMDRVLARRLPGARRRSGSATRPRDSCSSTCTAR